MQILLFFVLSLLRSLCVLRLSLRFTVWTDKGGREERQEWPAWSVLDGCNCRAKTCRDQVHLCNNWVDNSREKEKKNQNSVVRRRAHPPPCPPDRKEKFTLNAWLGSLISNFIHIKLDCFFFMSKQQVRVKVMTAAGSAARLRARLGLTDSLSSSEDQQSASGRCRTPSAADTASKTGDDYYDSITASHHHHPINRAKSRTLAGSPYSPLDSLERSLPSVGINYHYRSSSKRSSSYASSAGSSTTPGNSLPYHPWNWAWWFYF